PRSRRGPEPWCRVVPWAHCRQSGTRTGHRARRGQGSDRFDPVTDQVTGPPSPEPPSPVPPSHWEADVLLRDGKVAHIRPIRPEDADLLVDFYSRVSDESKYYRFFAPMPRLSDRDVKRFTQVDHEARVAFVLLSGPHMIAVGRYDSVSPGEAEVAFL